LRPSSPRRRKTLGASLTGGLEMAPQAHEKIESAPENAMAQEAADPQDVGAIVGAEIVPVLAAPAQDPLALEPPLTGGPEMAQQTPENIESMPGNGIAAEAAPGQGGASFVSPTAANLGIATRPNVRATLNGIVAC
jgi:hypothetical protein